MRRRSASDTALVFVSSIASSDRAWLNTIRSNCVTASRLPRARKASTRPCAATGCTITWSPPSTSDRLNRRPSARGDCSSDHSHGTRFDADSGAAASTAPWRSSRTDHPPVARTRAAAMPGRPWPSSTVRVRVCSASSDLVRTSYCSATCRVNTASVMAMNGMAYGTSNTGKDERSAASTMAFGTLRNENPRPNPRPARPAVTRRST